MGGKSRVTPLPPNTVRASRAISMASLTLLSLPKEICSGFSVPESFILPMWSARRVPLPTSISMFASFSCTSWYEAMGLPNCSRSFA
jgi:hypothetical protein